MLIRGKPLARRAIAVALLALVCSGCSLLPKEDEALKPPLVKPVKENYQIVEVKAGSVTKRISGVATIESTQMQNHEFTGTSGRIEQVLVVKDQMVKTGDPLMTLEAGDSGITLKERQRDYEQAKYNLDQSKLTKDQAKMKIRVMEMEIAEIRLNDARKAVEGKTLRALMDGKVTFVENVKAGDAVQANKTYVMISDPNALQLAYTSGNTTDLLEVQVGTSVEVTVGGKLWPGTVVQSPANTPATDNKQLADRYAKTLYIRVDEPQAQLTLGTTADISIVTRHKDNVLLVPPRALAQYLGRNYVKVLEGESIKEVDVEKGLETTESVEIVTGLKEGQKLILQ